MKNKFFIHQFWFIALVLLGTNGSIANAQENRLCDTEVFYTIEPDYPPTLCEKHQKEMFACKALWKGINMNNETRVNIKSSIIEDAITALKVDGIKNTISIENTVFNRNRVGIQLGRNIPSDPQGFTNLTVLGFAGNQFTCTSPLNGTTNEITFAGVLIQRLGGVISLGNLNGSENLFQRIQYGIYNGQYGSPHFVQ